ncbi:MAG: hypothetical protein ABJC12_10310 [Saprospiraceae bacterium]
MSFNPAIHNRKSIRLKGIDYAKPGFYFITVCIQNRKNLLGINSNEIMVPNDPDKMVERWYFELENKFQDIKCGPHIVMPNHFRCIIENLGYNKSCGIIRIMDNCTDEPMCSPSTENDEQIQLRGDDLGEHLDPVEHRDDLGGCFDDVGKHFGMLGERHDVDEQYGIPGDGFGIPGDGFGIPGEHIGSPLHRVMQWFGTMTTNEYIRGVKTFAWERFEKKFWQRGYWEHIIRNRSEHVRITNYILNNPKKWNSDTFRNT